MKQEIQLTQTIAGPVLFDASAMRLAAGYTEPFEATPIKPNGQIFVAMADGNMLAVIPGYSLKAIPGLRDFVGVFSPDNSDAGGRLALSAIVVIGCEAEAVAEEAVHMLQTRCLN